MGTRGLGQPWSVFPGHGLLSPQRSVTVNCVTLDCIGDASHCRGGKDLASSTKWRHRAGRPRPSSPHYAGGRHTRSPPWCPHVSVRGPYCCSGARRDTHQVHDEIQLDGEVYNEEDTGPGVPGVGGHHDVWKAVCVGQRVTLASKDAPCEGQLLPCTPRQPPSFHSALCALRPGRGCGGGEGVMDVPWLDEDRGQWWE